jgi:predicted ATPase/DNA-binding SARP family transcriptional activator
MTSLEFRVLGPLEIVRDGRPIQLGGPQQRKLLAVLLLDAGRVVRTDAVVDGLWGDQTPATAQKIVQKYVSQLRKELNGQSLIQTRAGGYVLEPGAAQIDATRFEQLLGAAGNKEPEQAARLLEEALSMWRGLPWSDLPDDESAGAERTRLEELRLAAIENLMDAQLALGRHRTQVARLEELVREHPLRERLWAALLLALYRSGRQAEALDAYQRLRGILTDELGIEPSPELQELHGRMLRQDTGLVLADEAEHPSGPATNLPAQITSFVGRHRELVQVKELLAGARLVTITGVGGCGKTRLALQAGAQLLNSNPDGVWLVSLEALTDSRLVYQSVASVFGAREQPGTSLTEVVIDLSKTKRMLLILDNCEHMIEACARFADELLRSAPDLRILATSRERLGISGEVVWQLLPMPIPQSEGLPAEALSHHEAIELFVDRAKAARPTFELTAENAGSVASISRQLDGIPLALELAATRVGTLAPHEIAARLEDRFLMLAEGSRTAPPRQQTLLAAIDWSYRLLSEPEQLLFDRTSVFAGGFTVEAAEGVCSSNGIAAADVVNLLSKLVDKSLIVHEVARGAGRYRLLETLRSYGRAQLRSRAELDAVRERHAVHFFELVKRSEPELRGPNQAVWLDRLEAEHDNLRAALEWACDRGEIGLRLATGLRRFWDTRGYVSEGLEWLTRALAATPEARDTLRARALAMAGSIAVDLGDSARAETFATESLDISNELGDERSIALSTHVLGWAAQHHGNYELAGELLADSLSRYERLLEKEAEHLEGLGELWDMGIVIHHLGMVARLRGDYKRARALHERSLALFRREGDGLRIGYSLWMLGVLDRYEGDYSLASEHCAQALSVMTELRDVSGAAHVRYTLGDVARLQGDYHRSVELYERSLGDLRRLGDKRCVASILGNLASVANQLVDRDRAVQMLSESLAIRRELMDNPGIAECLDGLAAVHAASNEFERAAELLGAAEALRATAGAKLPAAERADYEELVAAVRSGLGDEFKVWWDRGSVRPDDVVARADARA